MHVPILVKDVSLNYGISCFILFVCVHINIKKSEEKEKQNSLVLYGLRGIWFDEGTTQYKYFMDVIEAMDELSRVNGNNAQAST